MLLLKKYLMERFFSIKRELTGIFNLYYILGHAAFVVKSLGRFISS